MLNFSGNFLSLLDVWQNRNVDTTISISLWVFSCIMHTMLKSAKMQFSWLLLLYVGFCMWIHSVSQINLVSLMSVVKTACFCTGWLCDFAGRRRLKWVSFLYVVWHTEPFGYVYTLEWQRAIFFSFHNNLCLCACYLNVVENIVVSLFHVARWKKCHFNLNYI